MQDPSAGFGGEDPAMEERYPEDLSEVMDFSKFDLATTVRLIVLSGESRRVEVTKGHTQGYIYIKAGEIYRAVTNKNRGDAAVFEMMSWDKSVHRDFLEANPPEPNVRIPTPNLLDALKKMSYDW